MSSVAPNLGATITVSGADHYARAIGDIDFWSAT